VAGLTFEVCDLKAEVPDLRSGET